MKKTVTNISGRTFKVNTSNRACKKFGFKSGRRVRHFVVGEGTVVGVAPAIGYICGARFEVNVLWIAFDCHEGRVAHSFWGRIELKPPEKLLNSIMPPISQVGEAAFLYPFLSAYVHIYCRYWVCIED